jgi:hypothetical protein
VEKLVENEKFLLFIKRTILIILALVVCTSVIAIVLSGFLVAYFIFNCSIATSITVEILTLLFILLLPGIDSKYPEEDKKVKNERMV